MTKPKYDISKHPVMPEKCKSCPFRSNPELAATVTDRILTDGSQMCHSTGWPMSTHLCRGARDVQLSVFYAIGFLSAPTDEAWSAKRKELGV